MNEKPILFSGPMVRVLLNGAKSQTRRIITPQPVNGWAFENPPVLGRITSPHPMKNRFGVFIRKGLGTDFPEADLIPCPYPVGMRLWVRETFTTYRDHTPEEQKEVSEKLSRFSDGKVTDVVAEALSLPIRTGEQRVLYKADFGDWADNPDSDLGPWKPSIFMPRWASRLTIEVTDVRVQRVQHITEDDAKAEGVTPGQTVVGVGEQNDGRIAFHNPAIMSGNTLTATHRSAFACLWDSLNKQRGYGWDVNPWVWVYTFRGVES